MKIHIKYIIISIILDIYITLRSQRLDVCRVRYPNLDG